MKNTFKFGAGGLAAITFTAVLTGIYLEPEPISELRHIQESMNTHPQQQAIPKEILEKMEKEENADVDMAPGSGATTECQATNECYLPPDVTITIGGTVTWNNVDALTHTVTSGTPQDGPSGEFDSDLVMVGGDFSHKFEDAGTYDYFCIVHPWMQGTVKVIP